MTPATDAAPGWDEDGMCNDHGRFCCEACAINPQDTEAASQPREGDDADRANGVGQDELVAGFKRALQHPDGDHDGWTDAGMEDAFFRWPFIVRALNEALAQRPPEQAGAVPAGWKLVPETPTTLQMVKGNAMFHRGEVPINIYRAMVSAAPNASADTGGADQRLVERIRAAVTYQYMPMAVRQLLSEAASALSAAPTPPDAGPGEIPAGMVAWHGGDNAPADWDMGPVLCDDGKMYEPDSWDGGLDWKHGLSKRGIGVDIIAYTPKAPPQTPPDAGTIRALRSDVARLFEQDGNASCGECGAPLFDGDAMTTDEAENVALCAGHREPGAAIYSYRLTDAGSGSDGAGEREAQAKAIRLAMNPHGYLGEQCVQDIIDALSATQPGDGGRS